MVKNLPANTGTVGDTASIPGLGRSPGGGNGNPLQYSCLENSVYREAWQAIVHQAPLSMGLYRQEYWSGLPFPPPGDLPNPGMETASPAPPALAGGFFTAEPPEKPSLKTSLSALYLFLSEVAQSCLTLCDPMDSSLPGSAVDGIIVERILEEAAISPSRGSSQPRD